MKDLLVYILTELVGKDGYEVEEVKEDKLITFNISAKPEFIGRIIGKGGNVIKAIQDIIRIKAKLEGFDVYINIKEVE